MTGGLWSPRKRWLKILLRNRSDGQVSPHRRFTLLRSHRPRVLLNARALSALFAQLLIRDPRAQLATPPWLCTLRHRLGLLQTHKGGAPALPRGTRAAQTTLAQPPRRARGCTWGLLRVLLYSETFTWGHLKSCFNKNGTFGKIYGNKNGPCDFPGGWMAKTLSSQWMGPGSCPWAGS